MKMSLHRRTLRLAETTFVIGSVPKSRQQQQEVSNLVLPAGVPDRADCPRWPLRAALVKRDASLKPLDLKTLKIGFSGVGLRK